MAVDLAGEEALEAADDVSLASALAASAGDGVDRRLVEVHADDDGSVERGVRLPVAAAGKAWRVVLPEAGIGATPQSLAKAGSERIRSGLSPKTISISAALSAPMPKASRRLGDAVRVNSSRTRSWPAMSPASSSQRRERLKGGLRTGGRRLDRSAPEGGAAVEQRRVGERRELLAELRGSVDDDALECDQRLRPCLRGGVAGDFDLADHLAHAVGALGDRRR